MVNKKSYQIIDDALDSEQFKNIRDHLTSQDFPWFFTGDVAYDPKEYLAIRTKQEKDWSFYFRHMLYTDNLVVTSRPNWEIVQPLLDKLKANSLIRVKANAYTRTPEIIHHEDHYDFTFDHKGALFYINDCDGLTVLDDGTEIESVANRLLLFDPSKLHHSTTTTNAMRRININFNYI
jgi:hypothetical protein